MATKKNDEEIDFTDTVAQEEKEFQESLDVAPLAPPVTTTVIEINAANRGPGEFTFDAPQVPSGLRFATFDVTLTDADKLVLGREIVIQFHFSPNGQEPYAFANGTTWHSYGPAGLTVAGFP